MHPGGSAPKLKVVTIRQPAGASEKTVMKVIAASIFFSLLGLASAEPDTAINRVLFGSCIKQDQPIPIFDAILDHKPDVFLFLGDNIYADTTDMAVMREKYAKLGANAGFQRLMAECPILATWDDHDYGVNDGGAGFSKRVDAQREFLDFWSVPADSPRREREGIYNARIVGPEGKRVQFIMLDTRYFRNPLKTGEPRVGGRYYPDDDPKLTMLGRAQWDWLEEQLRQPAELRIIGSSIQFVPEASGQEAWSNLPRQRQQVLDLIAKTKANGVVFISGDRHWADLSVQTDDGAPYPIYDLTSSALNQIHPRGTPTENRFRVIDETYHKENFGEIEIDWEKGKLALRIRNLEGDVRIEKSVSLKTLAIDDQGCDLVLRGGRVMDPESGLDAIREIGVRDGKIVAISETPLVGSETIDATGLVVAPGFIDLHQHAQDEASYALKVRDGVTSAFELEVGTDDVAGWYRKHEGKLPIHHGVAIGHIKVRMKVMGDFPGFVPKGSDKAATQVASDEQLLALKAEIRQGLDEGAVAVGFGMRYTPVATRWEILEMFRVASEFSASCHVHIRLQGDESVESIQEVIAASAVTGAPLHVVHIQSTGGRETPKLLQMVSESQANGLDVTAECYPYTAGMTDISAAMFGPGWRAKYGLEYNDMQWPATGERLTEESFHKYRAQGGMILLHLNPESIVTHAVKHPAAMIASDGLSGHPRNAGTYARILGVYVRERGELSMMEALRKITLAPAQRLEKRVSAMKNKGRIRVGADADLTLFDLATVIDKATYTEASLPSHGIPIVIVGGVVVVRDQKLLDVRPGQAIRATQTNQ
ncbi:MAG: N-acyl-D-aspartate/D-glutamate deacylase [Verrucomicrobiales bacterium]